ncbi:protein of unknown function (plasmid) [Paraburkholderia dioscoreae]|uniref:Uncharacterized protein n=1 Tax=Paraburkholderia dioscoreae TaxID=2604047 RepID=A0A5Q4ZR60_9BURK|nr:protein of unknown function [Paraburkholderia dioscoreae]
MAGRRNGQSGNYASTNGLEWTRPWKVLVACATDFKMGRVPGHNSGAMRMQNKAGYHASG